MNINMKNSGFLRNSGKYENIYNKDKDRDRDVGYGNNNNSNNNGYNGNKLSMRGTYDNNQGLFTDPTLLKTIKDDLARISTSKNMHNGGIKDSNRWFK